jgi:serine protease Do
MVVIIRRLLVRSIWLFLALLLIPIAAHSDSADINAASRSVVRVAVFGKVDGERKLIGHSSGLAIGSGKIITNAHVVEESIYNENVTFQIIPSQGRESYMATVQKWSPGNDLALLTLEAGAQIPAASLYSGIVEDGEDVFAIGYPANVDIAMEMSAEDTLRPQAPVKTRGTVSTGRSSKSFDTLLHTAPIAPGNSGGPLVDSCGRVVGINSFGSTAETGGAEFYFAISVKEVLAFLRAQNVVLETVSGPCRSVAELSRDEAERDAAARAKIEAEQRVSAERKANVERKTRRSVEFAIIAMRENRMALAGLLLLLALGGAGACYALFDQGKRSPAKIAGAIAAALVLGGIFTFATRPSFDEVDERVKALLTNETGASVSIKQANEGKKSCVIQLDRSRVTVSNTADVNFDWTATGCINARSQYANNGGVWTRSFVPNNDPQVSVISFDAGQSQYRIERYLLGLDAMQKIRDARKRYNVNSCSANAAVQAKVSDMNEAVRNVLPPQPNEVLVFACEDAQK